MLTFVLKTQPNGDFLLVSSSRGIRREGEQILQEGTGTNVPGLLLGQVCACALDKRFDFITLEPELLPDPMGLDLPVADEPPERCS